MFHKENFQLNPIQSQDSEMLLNWRNHESIRKNMYTNHVITTEEHNQWFLGVLKAENCRAFLFHYKKEAIGFCNLYRLDPVHKTGTWTFYLANISQHTPRGCGRVLGFLAMNYFFSVLKYHKLYAEVISLNNKSLKMHQFLKWKEEGILKEHFLRDGQYHDIHLLAFFAANWLEQCQLIEKDLFYKQGA